MCFLLGMTVPRMPVTRREFLQKLSLLSASAVVSDSHRPRFTAGLIPFGRTTTETGIQDFWSHTEEVATLGVHHIEFNNTRAMIAERYLDRGTEFRDGLLACGVSMPGLAQYSHMDRRPELGAILQQHLLLGQFMSRIGGRYITHMIAPSQILNEVTDEEAYGRIDLKSWVSHLNQVARAVFERWGIKVAYHPEQREVSHRLYEQVLQSTDERDVHFIADVGHLVAGGANPVEVCRTYRKRLIAVHLKDFSTAPSGGSPLKAGNVAFGEGIVDLVAVVDELRKSSFGGWLMGESGASDSAMYQYMSQKLKLTF